MEVCTLIVDDQDDIRMLIRMMIELANEGLFVGGEAASGEDALATVDRIDPKVIVLDEMMPGMGGLAAARKILAKRPGQRIILCSAYLDEDMRRRAEEAGVRVCLPKTNIAALPGALRAMAG